MNLNPSIDSFLGIFFFSGSLLAFSEGIKHFLRRLIGNTKSLNLFTFGYINIGMMFFDYYYKNYVDYYDFSSTNAGDIILMLFCFSRIAFGPLILLYCNKVFTYKQIKLTSWLFHFFPAILLFALTPFIPLISCFNQEKAVFIIYIIDHITLIHLTIYLISTNVIFFRILKKIRNSFKISISLTISIITLYALLSALLLFNSIWDAKTVEKISIAVLNSAVFAIILYDSILPHVYSGRSLIYSLRTNEYDSIMKGDFRSSDNELEKYGAIEMRLKELLETEKVYLDENITLSALASKLRIKPHELSRYINSITDMTFNTFINKHRLDEAKRLMRENPDFTILHIAYMSGFNSKTVFYKTFSETEKISPTEFKKKLTDNTSDPSEK